MNQTDIATISRMVAQQLAEHDLRVESTLEEQRKEFERLGVARASAGKQAWDKQRDEWADKVMKALNVAVCKTLAPRDARLAELEARLGVAERMLAEEGRK